MNSWANMSCLSIKGANNIIMSHYIIDVEPSTHKIAVGRNLRLVLLLGGAVCALGGMAPVHAAEPAADTAQPKDLPGEIPGEIVVTAERRSQSSMTIPISITAISAMTLEKSNVRGIEDLVAQAPNVSFTSNGSRDRKEIAIRGVSNQLDPYSDVRPSSYGFYIDDFNVSPGTSNPDILDIERVEILRGPQATYYGRNAIGGAINITTKRPDNDWFGQINLGYASFNTFRVSGIVNLPIAKDVLAVRVSAQSETSDGNIKNINPIGGGNDTNYRTVRAVARFTPTDRFSWDFTYANSRERNGMRAGVPTGFLTQTWRNVHYAGQPGNIADPDGVGFYPTNRNRVNFNTPQSVGTDFWYASTKAEYQFDSFSITAVGGYLKANIFNKGDVDGSSLDLYNEDNATHRQSKSGEIRIQSIGDRTLEWALGVSVGLDTGQIDQSTFYGTQNKQLRPAGGVITRLVTDATDNYQAVFAQGTYHATDKLSVIVGGRYSWEQIQRDILRQSNGVTLDLVVDRKMSFRNFSPRVTLNYQATPSTLFYGTVSNGFKSGGVQSAQLSLKTSYDSETVRNYEVGFKARFFDNRLALDSSVFYLDWKNVQQAVRFQFLNSAGVLLNINGIDNAASARVFGADANATFRANRNIVVGAHVGYLDAKYEDYKNALIDGILIDASGKRMINAPKWTIGGDAEYRRPLTDAVDGYARVEVNYRSEILSSFFALRYNVFPLISPGYTTANVRLGLESERWRISAFVENLTDANYYSNAYEKAFYSGVQVEPSFRRFGMNLTYKFF
jgi:iron complex outermembrane receptor protein